MKPLGIIILLVGLCITIYTGFNLVTKEKVLDLGKVEITQEKDHKVTWSPLVGVLVMVVGAGVLIYGIKRR
ncbi:MAG: hypothetical protein EHM93_17560 [Bacteroidales bacterium]|nr:MAG: hypothetical protein EHM93_17560 [Bacteroidales bacterium]